MSTHVQSIHKLCLQLRHVRHSSLWRISGIFDNKILSYTIRYANRQKRALYTFLKIDWHYWYRYTETSEMDIVIIYPNITVYLIYNRILVCKLQDRRRSSSFTNFRKPIPAHVNIEVQYYTKQIVTRGIQTTYINGKCINI